MLKKGFLIWSVLFSTAVLFQCRSSKDIAAKELRQASIPTQKDHQHSDKILHPKNIILMIGDGMGIPQMTAGMYMNHNYLPLERCPVIGLHKSYSANDLITDSAAGATAFSIGRKTNNTYLGVDSSKTSYETILEYSNRIGRATGMVVTSTIVHATPAAFMSHQSGREDYEAIALDYMDIPANLLIGGGKKYFERRNSDSLDLVAQLRKNGYEVRDYFEQDYMNYTLPDVNKLVYFTADGDPLPASKGRSYLPKAAADACNFLKNKSEKGFFMMIEGSQIDWGGHANDASYVYTEVIDFNKAIEKVLDFAAADGQTLVIITGDHETGGLAINPGSKMGELVTAFTTNKHSADLIPVYAFGPGSASFSGIYENTAIYTKMMQLLK
jgi:alkaline phosphatase